MNNIGSLPVIIGHCPNCRADRKSFVVANYDRRDDDDIVWTFTVYRILECGGCEEVYFQKDQIFSEDEDYHENPVTGKTEPFIPHKISYWPSPSERVTPKWLPELLSINNDLFLLCNDIYVALNSDLPVLAAIGVRTVFDCASELLGIAPEKNFGEKIAELKDAGKIGADEKEILKTLTEAGSAAAHRGWRPDPQELDVMMNIIEAFLYRTFVLDAEAGRLKESVPKRKA